MAPPTYRELQAKCKALGVSASGKRSALVKRIEAAVAVAQGSNAPSAPDCPAASCISAAARVRALRPVAEARGSCSAGASEADLKSLVESLRLSGSAAGGVASLQVAEPKIPPSWGALWVESAEWHFSKDHYNCYGFNIFPPADVLKTTEQIFGDWECRTSWAEDMHARSEGEPSVADPGWLCVASFSEFDYLFCCFDRSSPCFGDVRHMVNNCCEERPVGSDALAITDRLVEWHDSAGDDEEAAADALSDVLFRATRHPEEAEPKVAQAEAPASTVAQLYMLGPMSAAALSEISGSGSSWMLGGASDENIADASVTHSDLAAAPAAARGVAERMSEALDGATLPASESDTVGRVVVVTGAGSAGQPDKEGLLAALGLKRAVDDKVLLDEARLVAKDYSSASAGFCFVEEDEEEGVEEDEDRRRVKATTAIMASDLSDHFELNFSDALVVAPVLYGGRASDGNVVAVLSMRVWT